MESEKTHFSIIFDVRKRKGSMLKKSTVKELEEKAQNVLQKIVERRQKLGLSQTDLALKLNMTISGYFKVEKGETKLDILRLIEIAEILEIEAKELF